MCKRPTLSDLAVAAGVSIATVDRVLNARHRVREPTAERVLGAAEAIGFHAAPLLKRRLRAETPVRAFGFLLQKPDAFYRQLGADLEAATGRLASCRGRAVIEFVTELSPAAIAERWRVSAKSPTRSAWSRSIIPASPRRSPARGTGQADLRAAFRPDGRGARGLCRPRQSEGGPDGGLDDRQDRAPAGQDRHHRRQPSLPLPRNRRNSSAPGCAKTPLASKRWSRWSISTIRASPTTPRWR